MQALARAGLRNPVRINVAVAGTPAAADAADGAGGGGGQKTPSELSIRYLVCNMEQKLPYLLHFLQVQPSTIAVPKALLLTSKQSR